MARDNDAREAEFERSERRRKGLVYLVLGVILAIAGAITVGVMLNQSAETLANRGGSKPGGGYTIIVIAGGAIVIGMMVLVVGVRILRGKIRDSDVAPEPLPEARVTKNDG